MRIGLISYADDPEQIVFRVVLLQDRDPDGELDNPRWVVEGIDPDRPVRMDKVGIEQTDLQGVRGTSGEDSLTISADLGQVVGVDLIGLEIVETVVVQPGEKTWEPLQELIDAMARLREQQGGE